MQFYTFNIFINVCNQVMVTQTVWSDNDNWRLDPETSLKCSWKANKKFVKGLHKKSNLERLIFTFFFLIECFYKSLCLSEYSNSFIRCWIRIIKTSNAFCRKRFYLILIQVLVTFYCSSIHANRLKWIWYEQLYNHDIKDDIFILLSDVECDDIWSDKLITYVEYFEEHNFAVNCYNCIWHPTLYRRWMIH